MNWLMKLLGGWLPIGTKPFPEWLGKIIWAVGICVAVNLLLGYFAPRPVITTVGAGGTQIVNQAEPRDTVGIGCNLFRLYVRGGLKAK